MKRVKRLFACLLALTMMLGLSATAFATTPPESKAQVPENGGTVTFEKQYTLTGEGTSPQETFKFYIGKPTVKDGGTNAAEQIIPTVNGVLYREGEATTVGLKKDVTVNLPIYTSVGVYSYPITETSGATAGVTYDSSTVTMKVTVINDNDNNTLKIASVVFEKDGEKFDATNEAAFTNTYTANKLNITKTVDGSLGDKSKYFKFTVKLEGTEDKIYPASYNVSATGSYGSNPTTIEFNKDTTFRLRHGDTVTIANLPKGVKYIVTENDYTDEGYVTTSKNAINTMDGTEKTAAFTNNKNGNIDTGVYLDNLPYILVFAGVLAIAAVFVVRRRRFED